MLGLGNAEDDAVIVSSEEILPEGLISDGLLPLCNVGQYHIEGLLVVGRLQLFVG
jgi:hypothetical protein